MLHRKWKATGLGGISLALLAAGTLAGSIGAPVAWAAGAGDGTVTVRVVTEVDADGAYDSVLEPGLAGVEVTLVDDAGNTLTATTGDDGTAVFTPASSDLVGGKYRVQVANPDPDNLSPAVAGLGTGDDVIRSNVGFVDVSGGTNVTYTTGFWEPGVYCQENPTLVTCNMTKGDAPGTYKGLVSFDGNFTNTSPGGTVTDLTTNTEQQAVFGIGTDRTGNKYMGTLVKRYAAYGPAGPVNAIYRYNDTSDAVTTFVTLPGALTEHDTADAWLHDDAIYPKVGREGLGDVDVSGDGKTLYAVNLNDSSLYTVPIQGTGDSVTAGTPTPTAVPKPADCVGDWHPYGIGVRGSRVLVGGVCGAESTVTDDAPWGDPSQLSAHVLEFKGGAFSEIFQYGLDYARGCAYRFTGDPADAYRCAKPSTVGDVMSGMWEAWNERVPDTEEHSFISAPQPILSNIEIADNGDLVFGMRDRFGDMTGAATYAHQAADDSRLLTGIAAGDVLRACVDGTTYTLENNGTCGSLTGNLPGNQEGPGDGEFYDDSTTLFDAVHDQITEGGTVLQPYRNKLWSTAYDPYDPYTQGARRWTADSGAVEGNLLIQSTWENDGATRAMLFGKANGLADLELVCDQAPVQIGNRVWYDADGDGIQDPSEPPVAGVVVTLTDTNGRTITATTDANGEYYIGTAEGLQPNTIYDVAFDYSGIDTSTLPGSPTLDSLKWTVKEAGSDRAIDSNVDTAGKTTLEVGDPGYVNHDVDAGIVGPVNKLGDYVWYDTDRDGIQDADEKPAPGVTVNLVDPATGDVIKSTTTDDAGKYLFDQLADGEYKVCFVKPDGYDWTKRDAGGAGDDSVVDPATGCSEPVTLGPDKREDLTLDAGLVTPLNTLGDYVWYDENGDGIQDSSEKPAPGVTVNLVDPATGDVIKSTKTDDAGKYLFDQLADGTYKVCFVKPEGYAWTKQNTGGAGDDSVVDPATGCSEPVTLGPDKREDLTLDGGLVPLNKLGDYVWYDADGDGIQDANEKPAPDVTVNLVDPKTNKVIKTTTTDKDGKYLFTDLPDGKYKVCFVKPNGYLWTKANAGGSGDDSVVSLTTGCSPVVTLGPGHREDLTLDAGLVKELGLTIAKTDAKTHKPLGGAVFQLWRDSNGTSGLQRTGAKKDTLVDDCATTQKGRCSFDGLPIGTYYLVEKDVPEGYVLPKNPVTGPYALTQQNAARGDGLVVKIANKRGEPCKGKC